jgi:hypothetical protein
MFSITNFLLQLVQTNRSNIDVCNFFICSILSYNISIFKFNGSAWALSPTTQTNKYQNTNFASGGDPSTVLDQYLGGLETSNWIWHAYVTITLDKPSNSNLNTCYPISFVIGHQLCVGQAPTHSPHNTHTHTHTHTHTTLYLLLEIVEVIKQLSHPHYHEC